MDLQLMGSSCNNLDVSLDAVLESIPVSWFHYRILLLCGLAFMTDSLEVNLLSYLSTCAGDEWGLSNEQRASITGIAFAGVLVGSLFWGEFADRYGRKFSFLIACLMICASGALCGVAPNYYWLIAFRAICGFGIGGANLPFDLLAEFLPSSHRGKFLIYIEFFWTAGSLFVTSLAWIFLNRYGWRFLTFLTATPVAILSMISFLCLPESPRWLLMKGRKEEAERIIADVAKINGVSLKPFSLLPEEPPDHHHDASYFDLLRDREHRKVSLPLWTVWGMFGFTYYGLILFVSRIYSDAGAADDDSDQQCSFDFSSIFINACSEVAGVVLSALCIDSLGRIRTQSLFYALAAVGVFLMGFQLPGAAITAVAMVGRMAIMSSSNVTWVSTPEVYKTDVRTIGHAVCMTCSNSGAFLCPFLVYSDAGYFTIACTLGAMNVLAAVAAAFLPETAGKFLDHGTVSTADHQDAPVSNPLEEGAISDNKSHTISAARDAV